MINPQNPQKLPIGNFWNIRFPYTPSKRLKSHLSHFFRKTGKHTEIGLKSPINEKQSHSEPELIKTRELDSKKCFFKYAE